MCLLCYRGCLVVASGVPAVVRAVSGRVRLVTRDASWSQVRSACKRPHRLKLQSNVNLAPNASMSCSSSAHSKLTRKRERTSHHDIVHSKLTFKKPGDACASSTSLEQQREGVEARDVAHDIVRTCAFTRVHAATAPWQARRLVP